MSLTDQPSHSYADQTVLVRADLNLPLSDDGTPLSDHRLAAVGQTIQYLTDGGARVLLATHLGRPKGPNDRALSTACLVPVLQRALPGVTIVYVADCVGEPVQRALSSLRPGSVALLENVRFHPGEVTNDPDFAAALAHTATCFVFDAFAVAHRQHASTVGVAAVMRSRGLPVQAGLVVHREVTALTTVLTAPKRPFVAVVGGSKLSSKRDALLGLVRAADVVVLVGGVALPFVQDDGQGAKEGDVQGAQKDAVRRDLVAAIRSQAATCSTQLVTPVDVVATSDSSTVPCILPTHKLRPDHHTVMDVGPDTLTALSHHITAAATILWNGPTGVFETEPFDQGTRALIAMLTAATRRGATTIIGGGHTVAAVERCGLDASFTHVSTGGGAMMAVLQGQQLPGLQGLRLTLKTDKDVDCAEHVDRAQRNPLSDVN